MKFDVSPIQRDFYLECLMNRSANTKYSINLIFSLSTVQSLSKTKLKEMICRVVNKQPVLISTPIIEKSSIYLSVVKPFLLEEIDYEQSKKSLDSLKKEELFHRPFDLLSDKRLFRVKVIENHPGRFYILFSVHHFIFDYYSAVAFSQQLMNEIEQDNILDEKDIIREQIDTINVFREKGGVQNFIDKFQARFTGHVDDISTIETEDILSAEKHEYRNQLKLDLKASNNYRSSVIIAAFAHRYLEITNQNSVLVGVPVPNRNRNNRNLITSIVTTYPILVKAGETLENCRKSICCQLLENLKMQFFDYNNYFYKVSKFDIMFTYYPSDFHLQCGNSCLSVNSLFTINSPAPIHIMLNDNNILITEMQTGCISNPEQYVRESVQNIFNNYSNGEGR